MSVFLSNNQKGTSMGYYVTYKEGEGRNAVEFKAADEVFAWMETYHAENGTLPMELAIFRAVLDLRPAA